MNYYNEIDNYAADWIENLIAAGHIPAGVVDRRSIEDVTPSDLAGFAQCHFFAGIAGWSLALRIAGVPDDYPIWTGSCPCQPFSAAGAKAGFDDERHLWPAFFHLIRECKPTAVFGEQVASKAAGPWIDLVHADLEGVGYAFGCVPFPAAGVGAPHIRDRNYWVAYASDDGLQGRLLGWPHAQRQTEHGSPGRVRPDFGLAACEFCGYKFDHDLLGKYGCPNCEGLGDTDRLADTGRQRWERRQGLSSGGHDDRENAGRIEGDDGPIGGDETGFSRDQRPGPTNGFWSAADWLACRDGKWRPVEPGTSPLAHGLSARVGRLRAYGNAISPWQAAEFLMAALP